MAFDPDAFLAGGTAVAEPPFDPDKFLAQAAPFDPDAFLAEPSTELATAPTQPSGFLETAKQIGKNIATVIAPEISVALNPAKSLSEVLPKTYEAATAPAQIVPKLQDSETAANITRVLGAPGGIGVLEAAIGPERFQAYSKAAINSGVDMANFLTSPVGASTLGLGALPAAVQKGASAAFMGAGMVHFPEAVDQWKNAKTDEEKAAAGINLLNLGAQIVLPALHLSGRPAAGGVTEGQARAPGLPQEVLDRATTQNQLQALAPESVPLSREVQPITPQAADGLHLAREKWVEELRSAPPEKQARLQVEIDDIDAQLLEADRQVVGESRARVAERGQSKPQESTPSPVDTATGGPLVESATSKLFTQARSEATPEVIAQAIEQDAVAITRELDGVVGDTLPPELPYQGGPGAMGPVEAAEMRPQSTGIKNAQVEAERIARGEDPMTKEEPLPNRQAIAEAVAANAAEPGRPLAIIEGINNSTRDARSISVADQASLMAHKVDLMNERTRQENILADGNRTPEEHIVANQELTAIEKKMNAVDQATEAMGTEGGRFLQLRQRLLREDFSLEAMERKARVKKGESLTPEERVKFKEQSEQLKALEKELADTQAKIQEQQSTKAIDQAVSAIKKQAEQSTSPETRFAPRVLALAESIVARLEGAATAARERIRERMSRASAGVDPTVVYDVAVIGVSKLARASLDFAKWSAEMKADLGDWVEPYLKDAWKQTETLWKQEENRLAPDDKPRVKKVRQRNLDEGQKRQGLEATIAQSGESGAPVGELASPVQKLALSLVRSGITDREMLIDRVHQTLQKAYPDVTRSQARDLISGYGEFKPLDKEAAKVTLRGLKGEMQQLGKIEDMQAKIPPKKTGIERREMTDTERQLIKEVNQLKQMGGFKITNPETQLKSALQAYKTRTANRITDLQDKLKRGDFSKPPRRELVLDNAALDLKAKIQNVKDEYAKGLFDYQLKNRSTGEKILDNTVQGLNTARAIQTSIDFSAVFRQGGFIALGNPLKAARAIPEMIKSFGSKTVADRAAQALKARPNYDLYQKVKLYLADVNTNKLSQMEEAYMSRWAQKIPGVAGSQRAYTTFLNRLRADSFDSLVKSLGGPDGMSIQEAKALANYVNVATGRGKIGKTGESAAALGAAFFSPRYVASRFQLLAGSPMWGGSARTRIAIAKEYTKFLAGLGTIYGLGLAAGAEIEADPRSSDFGKLKFGNTRVDFMTGLGQNATFVSRIGTLTTKTGRGDIVSLIEKEGESRKPFQPTGEGVLGRYIRTKVAPAPGAFMDWRFGRNVIGEKVTGKDALLGLVTPMSLRDIYENLQKEGVPKSMAMFLLNVFGAGVSNYDTSSSASRN